MKKSRFFEDFCKMLRGGNSNPKSNEVGNSKRGVLKTYCTLKNILEAKKSKRHRYTVLILGSKVAINEFSSGKFQLIKS